MFDLSAVQESLRTAGLDAWLLYDFRGINPLARRVCDMPDGKMLSRRWFYLIPAQGTPKKLTHIIEPAALDHLPGDNMPYMKWQELEAGVKSLLQGCVRVAMEYAPRNSNPYISRVDAGTVELVRSFGVEVVSSGDLIQLFEARWTPEQAALHFEAAKHTNSAYAVAFQFIAERLRADGRVMESVVQNRIMEHFAEHQLVTYHPPIIGVDDHAGDPHFETAPDRDYPIVPGSLVLIDLWAKCDRPNGVYSDLTRMAYIGDTVPEKYAKAFSVVAAARDAGIACVKDAFAAGRPLQGWEVDAATRKVIDDAGYGAAFIHRTGHSIGVEVHGNGTHMDNLETHETRLVIRNTCFSIEPGIYLPEFGVRSETNVYIDAQGAVHVTGGPLQTEIHCIRV